MPRKREADDEVRRGNAALYRWIANQNEVSLHRLIQMGPGALTGWLRGIGDTNSATMLQNARNAGNLILGFPEDFERELAETRGQNI